MTCAAMTRNVLNVWDVENFLGRIGQDDDSTAIRQWLNRVARRWILKDFPAAGQVLRARSDGAPGTARPGIARYDIAWSSSADSAGVTERHGPLPDWYARRAGTAYQWLDMDGPSALALASQLEGVVAYFSGLAGSTKFQRLDRIALPDAVRQAARFRAIADNLPGDVDPNTLMCFEKGYRMVLLRSAKELELEGRLMRNCAADYLGDLNFGCDLISLRDAKGRPHVTLEVQGGQWVHQVKGKANGPVAPRYRPMVLAFLEDMGLKLKEDRANLGILRRSFDPDDRDGWPAQPFLRERVQQDILDPCSGDAELAPFYEDAAASVDEMSPEAWAWFLDLFRQSHGGFVEFAVRDRYWVGPNSFRLLVPVFPSRLFWVHPNMRRSPRLRGFWREIGNELAGRLYGFCAHDDTTVIGIYALPDLLDVDFRRVRHDHQERVRRRLAKARRQVRRDFSAHPDYARLARWETDRRRLNRCLQEEADQHL